MRHLGLPFGFSSIWAGFDGSGLTTSRLQDKSVVGSLDACGWGNWTFRTMIMAPLRAFFWNSSAIQRLPSWHPSAAASP